MINSIHRLIFALAAIATFVLTTSARAEFDPYLELKSDLAITAIKQGSGLGRRSTVRIARQVLTTEGEFDYVETTLAHPQAGPIRLLLRGPRGFTSRTDHPYRALFLASGFFSGKESVRLIGSDPNTVGIGFEYPVRIEDLEKDPTAALAFVQKTPWQIAASLQWLREAGWLKAHSLIAVGISLGGVVMPVSLHLAQTLGAEVDGAIFGFTGAHLAPVAAKMLREQTVTPMTPKRLEQTLQLFNNAMTIHDPKLHLPFLEGKFLVVRAGADDVFPRESSLMLEQLLPSPKNIQVVPGTHINVDKTQMIQDTQVVLYQWLDQNFP